MDDQVWTHRIALALLKGIGPVNARNLVAYCGGVDALFSDPKIRLLLDKVPGIGPTLKASILDKKVLERARVELDNVRKAGQRLLFYQEPDYPTRLRHCGDAPVLLFVQGNADLSPARSVAIVGTRKPSDPGKLLCEKLVEGLRESAVTVVSGLAYGVDIVAHRAALDHGLPTLACVAHGLDRIYPSEHKASAEKIREAGALVSELPSGSPFAPGNFPARNRVIAGLADCTIVVESADKGGSLITADIANSYDREVMAFPGRPSDPRSTGCNKLIQDNKAHLITGPADVLRLMEWLPTAQAAAPRQTALFTELTAAERSLVDILEERGKADLDTLCFVSGMAPHRASGLLLELEFNGVVRALPGKMFALMG